MPKRKVQTSIKSFSGSSGGDQVDFKKARPSEEASNLSKSSSETKEEKKLLNRVDTDFGNIEFGCSKLSANGKAWNFKISSWNVASLRALIKKNGINFVKHESPDIMCFQETKCNESSAPEESKLKDYHRYFSAGEKAGYAGVALYSKKKPLKVSFGIKNKEYDKEGRVITAEYEDFFLVTAYVPNAGQKLVRLSRRLEWDPLFRSYLSSLDKKKPVVLCGDLNVAHQEIDLKNPTTNTRTAGFTEEEREGFTELLKEGFVDTFRKLYPDKTGAYTFWHYMGNARSRNAGWRLDYFVVSERLMPAVCDNVIRSDVFGSDHCPITLFLSL